MYRHIEMSYVELLEAGDNLLMIFFAGSSVVGATLTSLTYIATRAALVLDEPRQLAAKSDWEAGRLPKTAKEPSKEEARGSSERKSAWNRLEMSGFLSVFARFRRVFSRFAWFFELLLARKSAWEVLEPGRSGTW